MARGKRKQPSKALTKYVDQKIDNKFNKLSELKYHLLSTGSLPSAPTFQLPVSMQPVYQVGAGTGSNDRVGSKISPTSMQFRMTAYRGLTDSVLRVIFVRIKEVGFTRTATNILNNADDGNSNIVNAPYTHDKTLRSRFEVLYDKRFVLDDGKQNSITINDSIKMGKNILYDSTAPGANQQNGIYYIIFSDASLANAPDVRYTIYSRYRDL